MSDHQSLTLQKAGEIMEAVIARGDIASLTPEERARFYTRTCESLGLNPMTQPFAFITLNGKLTLYARKDATDQLRQIHNISVTELTESERDGVFIVTAKVRNSQGRTDAAKGAVTINGLKGDNLANALMKAECVPLDSEILTRDGFKRHDQVAIGDDVLSYDCGADACVWTPLLNITTYDSAPLVRMHSTKGQFSVLCTTDHSWAVRSAPYKARGTNARGPYKNRQPLRRLVKARDVNKGQSIILAAVESATEESLLLPVEAAILGWAVTDGTIQRKGSFVRVGICQSKEENFSAIRELVGDGVREIVSPARSRTFPSGRTYDTKPQHWWYLPSDVGRSLLAKAGYESRADLPKIVTRLNRTARAAMLQAMMLAEGDKRNIFANGDPSIMEAFDILCALQGTATGKLATKETIWTKRLKLTQHVAGAFLITEPASAAPVWCPTTAFGTWIMRQDGRVMITGNTKAKRRATLSICGLGFLDETELETISTTEKTLPKKDARDIYTKLQTAIDTAQSRVGLKAWLNANADRIKTMPEDWQDILRLRAEEKLADLREQEANTQVDVEPVVVTSTLDEAPETGDVVWDDPPQMDDKKWDHLKPSQQAGILCGDLAFRRFLQVDTGEQAAEAVRAHCIVTSRSQIKQNHASGRLWRELVAKYRAWLNDGDLDLSPQPSTNPTLTTAADAPPDASHNSSASGGDAFERLDEAPQITRLNKLLSDAAELGVTALVNEWEGLSAEERRMMRAAKDRVHKPRAVEVD